MKTINIREARQRLSELIDAAERGQASIITRRGKQVARIEPVVSTRKHPLPDLTEFRESIRKLNKKEVSLSQAVIEGRREARY